MLRIDLPIGRWVSQTGLECLKPSVGDFDLTAGVLNAMTRLFSLFVLSALSLPSAGLLYAQTHGTISEFSAVGSENLCEHDVPEVVCVLCHPELEARFREAGDWCRGHRVPESQCHRCHPDLSFEPLPEVGVGADYADLTMEQALEGISSHHVPGKITIFDFWAPWCAPCRNFDGHLRELASGNSNVAVRRIEVSDWDSPVAAAYMTGVSELPFVIVYLPDGSELGRLEGVTTESLNAMIHTPLIGISANDAPPSEDGRP